MLRILFILNYILYFSVTALELFYIYKLLNKKNNNFYTRLRMDNITALHSVYSSVNVFLLFIIVVLQTEPDGELKWSFNASVFDIVILVITLILIIYIYIKVKNRMKILTKENDSKLIVNSLEGVRSISQLDSRIDRLREIEDVSGFDSAYDFGGDLLLTYFNLFIFLV